MRLKVVQFISLLFASLSLGPALAHLLELPNKIHLPRDDYFTVQQIYRGWALLGIVIFSALLSTLILTVIVRNRRKMFALTLTALLCIVGAQIVFWIFTYPANQQTDNWTQMPTNWEGLRNQWEYSHATGAVLSLMAVIALILSILVEEE